MPATCTAQIVLGGSMSGWGGPGVAIGPVRIMYLVEGQRAAWVPEPVAHNSQEGPPITWIPSRPEQILADGLVMISALVDEDPKIRELIRDRLTPAQARALLGAEWSDLTELADECLEEIENSARKAVHSKLVITVMNGSSVTGQLALLVSMLHGRRGLHRFLDSPER
jgi:hypothetical protein